MKPILFSTEMVKAILDGRKTMTRRVIKPQPAIMANGKPLDGYNDSMIKAAGSFPDPNYKPGDILWVRETWCNISDWTCVDPSVGLPDGFIYKADWHARLEHPRWRPSIYMPKEAARIFLRVTGVRVERVQDILCGDMQREGCIPKTVTGGQWQQWQHDYWIPLWDSLNAKRGYRWDSNPFVWVIGFERIPASNSDSAPVTGANPSKSAGLDDNVHNKTATEPTFTLDAFDSFMQDAFGMKRVKEGTETTPNTVPAKEPNGNAPKQGAGEPDRLP